MKKIIRTTLILIALFFAYTVSIKSIYADTSSEGIEYWVSPKVVHIKNDDTLKTYLQSDSEATKKIVLDSKGLYFQTYSSEIQVSNRSMYIEIIGHVFPDKVAKYLPKWLASIITDHTSIIDSGEASVDSNRWVWDSIAFVVADFQSPLSNKLLRGSTDDIVDSIYNRYNNSEGIVLNKEVMEKVVKDIQNKEIDPILLQ